MFWSSYNRLYPDNSGASGSFSSQMTDDFGGYVVVDYSDSASSSAGGGGGGHGGGSGGGRGRDEELLRDAYDFALKATEQDSLGEYRTAIFYYVEAIQAMYNAHLANPTKNLSEKYAEYADRVKALKDIVNKTAGGSHVGAASVQPTCRVSEEAERASFLIYQAFQLEEEGGDEEAAELYLNAAELCIKASKTSSPEQKTKLNRLAKQALDRAEALKKKSVTSSLPSPPRDKLSTKNQNLPNDNPVLNLPEIPNDLPSLDNETPSSATGKNTPKENGRGRSTSGSAGSSTTSGRGGGGGGSGGSSGGGGGGGKYTPEEIAVLRKTSEINGRSYLPFISQADLKERFAYPVPFTDKDGKLVLCTKQKDRLGKWVRPSDICSDPKLIYAVSSFSVRQTIVQDCSFLASLAISANYERRFKKHLLTNIIYPQDRSHKPIYNPCGKYMAILWINGVKRKVIIDDYLPVDKHGDLLCSFSSNRNEFWVSLLEKAYMKVMGGYDFPGSNSNIDLHALTGWIPERVAIRMNSPDFDADKVFKKLYERFHRGDVLATVATGMLPEAEADRAGLVPTHAYAMLDIREIQGKKLLQLKNPWSHLRWKGRFSEADTKNWTPELQKALNFDPKNAQEFDNGVFWIDLASLCNFFDVIYMNWNPSLFPHTYIMHGMWSAAEGPKKDNINIGNNPQYRLEVKGLGAMWILLTRHITDKDDFADNKEFITLLVYKGGKKVYYPNDPGPFMDGTRINSPHYLCKMIVNDKSSSIYTIIVSQFEKNNTIHYTLRAYGTCEFKLSKIVDPYKYTKNITGEWKGKTAGGCANNRETYVNNPIYQVCLQDHTRGNSLLIDLKGPKNYHVGFEVICVSSEGKGSTRFEKKMSGDYRNGFTILELEDIPSGVYNIRPTTFSPGQESPFFLTISSSCPMKVVHLH
ncbi:calpain-7-like isoform X2 [Lytechinus variegatus]|uniref:calpain-7-like isoform X2 n=1 Tax=Lytechinus variegatus TaxID=7654 RepID=UPI001BB277D8|nr:calpain-7-like isoform X2 [Lytechinus variegatus]